MLLSTAARRLFGLLAAVSWVALGHPHVQLLGSLATRLRGARIGQQAPASFVEVERLLHRRRLNSEPEADENGVEQMAVLDNIASDEDCKASCVNTAPCNIMVYDPVKATCVLATVKGDGDVLTLDGSVVKGDAIADGRENMVEHKKDEDKAEEDGDSVEKDEDKAEEGGDSVEKAEDKAEEDGDSVEKAAEESVEEADAKKAEEDALKKKADEEEEERAASAAAAEHEAKVAELDADRRMAEQEADEQVRISKDAKAAEIEELEKLETPEEKEAKMRESGAMEAFEGALEDEASFSTTVVATFDASNVDCSSCAQHGRSHHHHHHRR